MFCSKCGQENASNAKFCIKCGNKISLNALQNQISELEITKAKIKTEISSLANQANELSNKVQELNCIRDNVKNQIYDYTFEINMQDYGMYKPTYVFVNSDLYKERLKDIRSKQKEMIRTNQACFGNVDWAVNGNKAQGRKMVKDMQKLLLRAFNVECDDIIDNVKISNFDRSKERIYKSSEQISKLGTIMSISITPAYINLKTEELCLALDFQEKKQEEKERIRELREQQREEAKSLKEIEEARKK